MCNKSITLPLPPASLSGHNTGHWSKRASIIKKVRLEAKWAALHAGWKRPADNHCDIPMVMHFTPPMKNPGDRLNYPNRAKPIWDGIADAMGIDDKRILPHFVYTASAGHGQIEVVFDGDCLQ